MAPCPQPHICYLAGQILRLDGRPNEKEYEKASFSICALSGCLRAQTHHTYHLSGSFILPMYVYHPMNGPGGIN